MTAMRRASWHAEAIELYRSGQGWTYEALGAHFKVTRFAVYRAVRRSVTARGVAQPLLKSDPAAYRARRTEAMRRHREKKRER